MKEATPQDLVGLTMASVVNEGNDRLVFKAADGRQFAFFHDSDCCEIVQIESVAGDLADLVGEPLLLAEESTNRDSHPPGYKSESESEWEPESYTWTFYKFATRKGYVDVRWLGESSGYYSESVDFAEETAAS